MISQDKMTTRSRIGPHGSDPVRPATERAAPSSDDGNWRSTNVGRLMNRAVVRFETQVMRLLQQRGFAEVRTAHVAVTRNLDLDGTRASEIARRAGMTKQAMGELIGQCEALGLVRREPDPNDGRAKFVLFTGLGLNFMEGFRRAVAETQAEMEAEIGADCMVALLNGLRRYASDALPETSASVEEGPATQEVGRWSRPRRRSA
jgi:DNA-binding MarR family transcriptional regulator